MKVYKDNSRKIILLVLIMTAAVLVVFVFWRKNNREENINLISFVPEEASAWSQINLDNENLIKYLAGKKEAIVLIEDYLIKNELPAGLWRSGIGIKQIMLVNIPVQKKEEKVWLILTDENASQLVSAAMDNYYFASLQKQVAAVSKSGEALKVISERKPFDFFSKVGEKKEDDLANGYIKISELADQLPEAVASKIIERERYLSMDEYLSWRVFVEQENLINFEINLPLKKDIETADNNIEGIFYDWENVIAVKNFSLSGLAGNFFNAVAGEAATGQGLFGGWGNKYGEQTERLYTFFKQPGFLVLKPKARLVSLSQAMDIDNFFYCFVINKAGGISEQGELGAELEKTIQNYLAYKYPSRRVKVLPDKTKGIELVADANAFKWQKTQEDGPVKILKYSEGEFGYGFFGGRFVAGNSAELVLAVGRAKQSREALAESDLVVDMDIIDSKYGLLGEKLWLTNEITGKKLFVRGKFEARK